MARSKIEWLARPGTIPESWNPVSGCDPDDGFQSEACTHCYARRMSKRLAGRAGYPEDEPFRVTWHPDRLGDPLRWRKPRTVFVCSMGDLFHADVPDEFIFKVFGVMASRYASYMERKYTGNRSYPAHTFLVLTKRPERALSLLGDRHNAYRVAAQARGTWTCQNWVDICGGRPWPGWPLPNVWLGVTAENQQRANERIPILLRMPAVVHFVSCEPLLGNLDLTPWLPGVCPVHNIIHRGGRNCLVPRDERLPCLDWVIAGGETGSRARPTHPEWALHLEHQVEQANLPFFWKGWGEWLPHPNYGDVAPEGRWTDEALQHHRGMWLTTTGETVPEWHDAPSSSTHYMYRVGRNQSGRWLKGREWDEWPMT